MVILKQNIADVWENNPKINEMITRCIDRTKGQLNIEVFVLFLCKYVSL